MRRLHTTVDTACVLLGLAGGLAPTSGAESHDASAEVQVRSGAVRSARGVHGGVILPAEHPEAVPLLAAVREARELLAPALRVPVIVQVEPLAVTFAASRGPVHTYAGAGTIAVGGGGSGMERSIWLHELVHLAAAGARPTGLAGSRLMTAVDEAGADFGAAVFGGSPVVGGRAAGEARDLRAPPPVGDSEWAYLAFPEAPFDAHRLGWALAGALHREEASTHESLATDVVRALASRAPFDTDAPPGTVLAQWLSRCPARSRPALARAVRRWIPTELFPAEGTS